MFFENIINLLDNCNFRVLNTVISGLGITNDRHSPWSLGLFNPMENKHLISDNIKCFFDQSVVFDFDYYQLYSIKDFQSINLLYQDRFIEFIIIGDADNNDIILVNNENDIVYQYDLDNNKFFLCIKFIDFIRILTVKLFIGYFGWDDANLVKIIDDGLKSKYGNIFK